MDKIVINGIEYKITKFSDLSCCPFCGCETFYINHHTEGIIHHTFNPKENKVNDEYINLSTHYNVRVYCEKCDNYLGNIKTDKIGITALTALKEKNEEQFD